jgi:hypothetical protein
VQGKRREQRGWVCSTVKPRVVRCQPLKRLRLPGASILEQGFRLLAIELEIWGSGQRTNGETWRRHDDLLHDLPADPRSGQKGSKDRLTKIFRHR